MASIAQLVRAPVCGTGCRQFESDYSPHFFLLYLSFVAFCLLFNVHYLFVE